MDIKKILILLLFATNLFAQISESWTTEQKQFARKGDILDSSKTTLKVDSTSTSYIMGNLALGQKTSNTKLTVIGDAQIVDSDLESTGGLKSALKIQSSLVGNVSGNQWGGVFSAQYTKTGESDITEVDGYLSALYHDYPFEIPIYKGYEGGGAFLNNASATINKSFAFDGNFPTVTSGSVDTAAAFHVASQSTAGISNPFSILSENTAPSFITGALTVASILTGRSIQAGTGSESNSYIDMMDNNGVNYRLGNGVTGNGKLSIQAISGSTFYEMDISGNHNFKNGSITTTASVTATNYNYATDTSSTDAYKVVISGISTLATGLEITFKTLNPNTDGATLTINALTTKAITKASGGVINTALATGDILAGQIVKCVYDGTQFQVISRLAQ